MLRRYHLFILFLKLNIFFCVGIVFQILGVIYYNQKYDKLVLSRIVDLDSVTDVSQSTTQLVIVPSCVIMAVAGIVFYAVGWFGVRRGNYWLMSLFLMLMVANAAAISYALYIVYMDPEYRVTIIFLTFFGTHFEDLLLGVIQMLLNVATVVSAIFCMLDFEAGLVQVCMLCEMLIFKYVPKKTREIKKCRESNWISIIMGITIS